jgi:type IV pilus assembly protein PilM
MKIRKSYGLVGVDLGSRAIKLAQLERAASGLRLVNARAIIRAPQATEADGDAICWWEEALGGERLDKEFFGREAACAASAPSAELQLLTIPDGTRKEQHAMLAGELASQLAAPIEQYAVDFWPIRGASAATAEENVAAATMSLDDGERISQALRSAGLICKCIEPKPLAVGRAQTLAGTSPTEPVAVLDWGYEQACLSIIDRGQPKFFRNLRDCGFQRWINSLVQALAISPTDAQTLLAAVGVAGPRAADPELAAAREAIENVAVRPLQALLVELQKTLSYIAEHRPRLKTGELRICGGGATIRNVAPRLQQRLNRPVGTWRCEPLMDLGMLEESAPLFASALALSSLKWSEGDDEDL